jgi:predicted P-loop ATPase/GTPase
MNSSVHDIFFRIQGIKKEQRTLRALYRDALKNSHEYQEVYAELERLREKKKTIEDSIKAQFNREMEKLDELKGQLHEDGQLLTDSVLTRLMKGEIVKVVDVYNNSYNPIVKVTFKKSEE